MIPLYFQEIPPGSIVLTFCELLETEKEELYKKILEASIKSFMQYKTKMKPIPVLPKEIELSNINKAQIDFDFIPVGMVKKDLGIASIKLKDEMSYLLSFRDFDENLSFVDKFLRVLDNGNMNTIVFDAKYLYDTTPFKNITYLNTNYSQSIESLNNFINQVDEILVKNNLEKI